MLSCRQKAGFAAGTTGKKQTMLKIDIERTAATGGVLYTDEDQAREQSKPAGLRRPAQADKQPKRTVVKESEVIKK
jgi:hypothetical protein